MRSVTAALAVAVAQLLGPAEDRATKQANEHYAEGRLDEALSDYTQAQVEHPDAPELHYNIGNVEFKKQELDDAMAAYRSVLDAEPELRRRVHFNMGNVHFAQEKWEEAVAAYSEALKIDPDDVEARQNLELALQKLQQEQQEPEESPQGGGGGEGEDDTKDEGEDVQQRQDDAEESGEGEDSEQDQGPSPSPTDSGAGEQSAAQQSVEMSPEEAEQLLQALAQLEKAAQLREQQERRSKARGRGKIW